MIDLSIYTVFLLPAGLNLVVILLLWLYYSNRTEGLEKPVAEGRLYRCSQCGYVYIETFGRPGTECPRCGAYNDAIKR